MKYIKLTCDLNPLECLEITYDKYGLHISVIDENLDYHEIRLTGKSVEYFFDFINEIKQGGAS